MFCVTGVKSFVNEIRIEFDSELIALAFECVLDASTNDLYINQLASAIDTRANPRGKSLLCTNLAPATRYKLVYNVHCTLCGAISQATTSWSSCLFNHNDFYLLGFCFLNYRNM